MPVRRLWVVSDLHLEFGNGADLTPPPDVDVCVLAGDIHGPLRQSVIWAERNAVPAAPTVLVPGNHEFYGYGYREELRAAADLAAEVDGLHLLHDDLAIVAGIRFLGATLWTDYALYGHGLAERAMSHAASAMNDHSRIRFPNAGDRRFSPEDARQQHDRSRRFLRDALHVGFDGPTVVLTHHLPHEKSVAEQFEGDLLNTAFASDLSELFEFGRPNLWIHGHTHSSCDYVIGDTRVVCNPRGYTRIRNENASFDPGLIVEIEV